jgi:hypothetical protein
MPKDLARIEALSSDGFIIYRSLLLDLSLDPQACEMVIVQPGHILFDKSRFDTILGREEDCNVIGHPQYRKLRAEPFTLSSTDKTGRVDLFWEVRDTDRVLEVGLHLEIGSSVMIDASVCDIAARSWNLIYDSRNWDCSHGSGKACLVQGEKIEELTPGNELELEVSREWTSMKLYRSYGNELGQVACLLSTEKRGMVKTEACLRCCLSYSQEKGLDYLID